MSLSKKVEDKVEEGLIYLLTSFVKTLTRPIVWLANRILQKIQTYRNKKHIERSFVQIEYSRMIKEICKRYGVNCLAFRLTNGTKSITGYSYKNIKVFYSYLTLCDNKILKDFVYVPVPLHMYSDLLEYCKVGSVINVELEKDIETALLFNGYRHVHCKVINDIFYVVMGDELIDDNVFPYLNEILVKLN
jgi:hypothetical protein